VGTPAWSPDGSRIAVQSTIAGGPNIWVMNAECASLPEGCGSNLVQITRNPAKDLNAAWSPDGSRIAFDSNLGGPLVTLVPGYQINAEDIYVMNVDGSNVVRLTNHPDRDFDPAWSPDGTRIAFVSSRDGNHDIYVMNAECASLPEGCGSNVIRLTDGPGLDLSPDWSPDGSRIAFRDGDFHISVVNAECASLPEGCGSNLVQLTAGSACDWDPAWSPDGSLIAFRSNRDGNHDIYVMNADGTNVTRLTDDPAEDGRPAWEPSPSASPVSSSPPTPTPSPSAPATTGSGLAPVESVEIYKSESDPLQVYATANGHFPNFCTGTGDWSQTRDGNAFTVTLLSAPTDRPACADSGQTSFGVSVPLSTG
jgi:Tol biopolymer transport system component